MLNKAHFPASIRGMEQNERSCPLESYLVLTLSYAQLNSFHPSRRAGTTLSTGDELKAIASHHISYERRHEGGNEETYPPLR